MVSALAAYVVFGEIRGACIGPLTLLSVPQESPRPDPPPPIGLKPKLVGIRHGPATWQAPTPQEPKKAQLQGFGSSAGGCMVEGVKLVILVLREALDFYPQKVYVRVFCRNLLEDIRFELQSQT